MRPGDTRVGDSHRVEGAHSVEEHEQNGHHHEHVRDVRERGKGFDARHETQDHEEGQEQCDEGALL